LSVAFADRLAFAFAPGKLALRAKPTKDCAFKVELVDTLSFCPLPFSINFSLSLSFAFSLLVFSSWIEARAALRSVLFLFYFSFLLSFSSTRTQQPGNVEENFLSLSLWVLCDGFQSR
jgi:hypothetical protein